VFRSQEGLRRELLHDMAALDARLESLRSVPAARLSAAPAAGGWSAAEVLEHLCVAADSYLERLERIVADRAGRRVDDLEKQAWRPSLAGRLLVVAMESERKTRAPKIYRPPGPPRDAVVAAFIGRQERLTRLLHATRDLDWRRTRFVSPVSPLVRMNLGDALLVLVRHAERHWGQIERTLQSLTVFVP
jgi:uncharacterized damage-inducible protein DinB